MILRLKKQLDELEVHKPKDWSENLVTPQKFVGYRYLYMNPLIESLDRSKNRVLKKLEDFTYNNNNHMLDFTLSTSIPQTCSPKPRIIASESKGTK